MKIYKFNEKKLVWFSLSMIIIMIGFSLMAYRGIKNESTLNYGIDFVGGTTFLLKLQEDIPSNSKLSEIIRNNLKQFNLEKSIIQISNKNEVHIKTLELTGVSQKNILESLESSIPKFEILEKDFIGPTIGNELKRTSFWITICTSIVLLLYISIRFQLNYGIASLLALLHDALITISIASIFNLEINTSFVAAILTILGYSINDTIVIFDRIRENAKKLKEKLTFEKIIDKAISQTLIRTINTSMTTMLVLGTLILFGGSTIKEFCLILFIGVISGTYSSLFIASPILLIFNKNKK
jgi:preprotein translocase subunit SecF